jgi:hypothetical protein
MLYLHIDEFMRDRLVVISSTAVNISSASSSNGSCDISGDQSALMIGTLNLTGTHIHEHPASVVKVNSSRVAGDDSRTI